MLRVTLTNKLSNASTCATQKMRRRITKNKRKKSKYIQKINSENNDRKKIKMTYKKCRIHTYTFSATKNKF